MTLPETHQRRSIWIAAAIIVVATLGVYSNTLTIPFFFDDIPSIVNNPSIKEFKAAKDVLAPPVLGGAGIAGRPMVNLSLAINHALGGEKVWGYHAFNLLIHVLSGLALFGIVRRTLVQGWKPEGGDSHPSSLCDLPTSLLIALAAALFWTLHPLQTETVTCVIQRTEGLMGLFYLLTFYCFVRALDSGSSPLRWQLACWMSCALGMATKEVMVSAPVLLFLFDRSFGAGSFTGAWRARRWFYCFLAATWGMLIIVMVLSASRGGTVGFGHGVSAWDYALTQCRAIILYLKLSFWPAPLVLDYGMQIVRNPMEVLPQGLVLLALVAGTLYSLWKRPVAGFIGMWFFAILAPSSSIVPLVTQTIAEHRMYLPLAAITTPFVWLIFRKGARWGVAFSAAICIALGTATFLRNATYASIEGLWKDTAAKCPGNHRAHYSLVLLCEKEGRFDEMIDHYYATLRAKPDHVVSQYNLAFHLASRNRFEEALPHYREAVRLEPDSVDALTGLGTTLLRLQRVPEAKLIFEKAVRLEPKKAPVQFNLGQSLYMLGELDRAIEHFEKAAALQPGFTEAYNRIGNAQAMAGRFAQAVEAFREALKLEPKRFELQLNLGTALLYAGKSAEAITYLEQAVKSDPGHARANALLAEARGY